MAEQDFRREQLRLRVERVGNLPALPEVVSRIIEMVDSAATTGRQLGHEIAKDQVLSAKVLKLVNSGFYGFSQPISTISHAVTMLGFNTVKSLVLSSSVLELMDQALPGLWDHSLACARVSALLAEHLERPNPEEISVIGLLHDLGKVVLFRVLPKEFEQVRSTVLRRDVLFCQAEEEVLGVDHGLLGSWLLEKWALPAKLVEPIAEHHHFNPRHDHSDRTALLLLADVLCRAAAFGNGGDRKIPRLPAEALEVMGVSLPVVEEVVERMAAELGDIPRQ
jgi:putative nucleotidyltransferase with HDIG domain